MDLRLRPEHEAFQNEVEAFLVEFWHGQTNRADIAAFRNAATERGYLYRGIPKRYGGSEQPADVIRAEIIRSAFARAAAPRETPGIGVQLLVPTLLECGAEWQKEAFIAKTLSGEYRWAQGYSEPGAGSDLASLRSRAELRGEEWVINGHKIWTTLAHTATHIFMLVRTEPQAPKREGISYLLLRADQPGVQIRPIKQINGGREFCEMFFEDARTPADWIVGERGQGWKVSKSTLKHERNAVGSSERTLPMFQRLVKLARRSRIDGVPAIDNPLIRDRLATIAGHVEAQLWAGQYQLALAARDEPAGVLGLTNKMNTANINQEIAAVASDILEATGLLAPPANDAAGGDEKWVRQILGSLAVATAGGTSNIQRNIIAERGLGLPRGDTPERD